MWSMLLVTACLGTATDTSAEDDTGTSPVGDSATDTDSSSSTDSPADDSGPDDIDDSGPDDTDDSDPDDTGEPDDTGDPDDTGEPDDTGSSDDSGPDDSASPATEDCTNGLDDDGDSLLDCEDEDCEGASDCGEIDCSDGVDGDGDGLLDCEDDDCWSPECEGVAWARVTGGRMYVKESEASSQANYWGDGTDNCDFGWWEEGRETRRWWAKASGTVRFIQSSTLQTCTWTALPAHYNYRREHFSSFNGTTSHGRTSGGRWTYFCNTSVDTSINTTISSSGRTLAVESGCALTRTDFLPEPGSLVVDYGRRLASGVQLNTADGATWYKGDITYASSVHGSGGSGSGWSSYAWVEPLEPMGTFMTTP